MHYTIRDTRRITQIVESLLVIFVRKFYKLSAVTLWLSLVTLVALIVLKVQTI